MSITVTAPSCSFCKKTTAEVRRFFFGMSGRMCSECLDKLIRALGAADPQWRERTISALVEARKAPPPAAPPSEISQIAEQAEREGIRLS
jgi:hypothetical protein